VAYPRLVLVDVQVPEHSPHENDENGVRYLFIKGAVAHPDFFDDMYAKAKEMIPGFNLGSVFDESKKANEEELQTMLAFRQYLGKNRSSPDAHISLEVLANLGFSDDELKRAKFWAERLNDRIVVKKVQGKFTTFSAPIFRKYHFSSYSCLKDDKVLEILRDNHVIFSFERRGRYDDECYYIIRW